MRLTLIFFTISLLLTGCSSIEKRNFGAAISVWDEKLYSNNLGSISRAIEFCANFDLSDRLQLQVHFDCLLDPLHVLLYQRAFERYHHAILEKLNTSLVAGFFQIDKPVCLYIVHPDTRFLIGKAMTDCIHLYVPAMNKQQMEIVTAELLALNYSLTPEPRLADAKKYSAAFTAINELEFLYAKMVLRIYPLLVHEYFHYQSLPLKQFRPWRKKPDGVFYSLWINEYLAYTLFNFVIHTTFNTLDYNIISPATGNVTLGNFTMDYQLEPGLQAVCHQDHTNQSWFQRLHASPKVISDAGKLLSRAVHQQVFQGNHLYPLYAYYEFTSLADPGMGFADLIARIPACNLGKTLPVHAFKHQLLDYNFATLLTNEPTDDIDAKSGYGQLLRTSWRQQLKLKSTFLPCNELSDDPNVQLVCSSLLLDGLFWQQGRLAQQQNVLDIKLPVAAEMYQPRLDSWLTDFSLMQSGLAVDQYPIYQLAADARFRDHQHRVADTAAGVNVWPEDSNCDMTGQQSVLTLAGEEKLLARCRFEQSLGVLWRKDGQNDKVVGLPTLVAQQARLIRDASAMQQRETVPYVFQDGFVVFQQMDQQVRLNICLDTGSPLSYITRRYRERYQLTPTYLASRLESETEVGELPRRVVLPILNAQRKVRVLPHDGFMQCDIIMGSDLLEQYSAIELGTNTLTLWYAQDPITTRLN